ncbi:hypothetical protein PAECIP111894_05439 [Paenibacillus pseudetheri]|uniref:Uncharacterized protein n=1 Tax=Paenibacillus pseudetheri TaxID=2897682 RepID=A0ABM9BKY7_9BACL|nr:hypothetical protein PAECIP111894_05439 [Paenibacillus pseudetheri]
MSSGAKGSLRYLRRKLKNRWKQSNGTIVKHKGFHILVMRNMWNPLCNLIFLSLGLDNFHSRSFFSSHNNHIFITVNQIKNGPD